MLIHLSNQAITCTEGLCPGPDGVTPPGPSFGGVGSPVKQ
jgi:hypothetical protein